MMTLAPLAALALPFFAEVATHAPDAFTLRQEAVSTLAPDALWTRLTSPASWWADAHTYSGDAVNLSFEAKSGACWCEAWDGGSVAHGRVLTVMPPKTLVLDAPFGPLQSMPATTIWTITLTPEGEGTRVTSEQRASGAEGLGDLAAPVDAVMTEAISRLAAAA